MNLIVSNPLCFVPRTLSSCRYFFRACGLEKENLCLYGHPNDTWEVTLPAEEVPPELPEPALGINFARDGMKRQDWLSLVAVHSDSWLVSVAFYFGARFNKNERYNTSFLSDLVIYISFHLFYIGHRLVIRLFPL